MILLFVKNEGEEIFDVIINNSRFSETTSDLIIIKIFKKKKIFFELLKNGSRRFIVFYCLVFEMNKKKKIKNLYEELNLCGILFLK
jgi:hypothetical protein